MIVGLALDAIDSKSVHKLVKKGANSGYEKVEKEKNVVFMEHS